MRSDIHGFILLYMRIDCGLRWKFCGGIDDVFIEIYLVHYMFIDHSPLNMTYPPCAGSMSVQCWPSVCDAGPALN